MTRHPSPLLARKLAASYDEMFRGVLELQPGAENRVRSMISWAKATLKKQDRITWYLRWARLSVLGTYAADFSEANENQEKTAKLRDRLFAEAKAKSGALDADLLDDVRNWKRLQDNLTHFYGLELDAIDKYVPKFEAPSQLESIFEGFEAEARAEADGNERLLEPQHGDEVFLDLGQGWAWWELDRHSCREEGNAMGHCGNAGGRSGDRILSLRQRRKITGDEFWEPFLTFILGPGGSIGEMKGRNNEKPVARYHTAIVALLSDPRIRMVLGGGYLPENNFSFNDLPSADRKRVREANPELATSLIQAYRKHGIDGILPIVEGMLDVPYEKGIGFVIEKFSDAEHVLDLLGDGEMQKRLQGNFADDSDPEGAAEIALRDLEDGDPALGDLVRSFINEFPGLRGHIEEDFAATSVASVKQLVLEMLDEHPDAETLRALILPHTITDDMVRALYETWADREGSEASLFKANNGTWYYAVDDGSAVERAEEGETLDHVAYPVLKWDDDVMGGLARDRSSLPRPAPRSLDQPRLYPEPSTDAQAQHEGIHVSHLLEPRFAADYEAMFKELRTLAPQFDANYAREIQWAKTNLKKQNRITWYLRWVRLYYARAGTFGQTPTDENKAQLVTLYQRWCRDAKTTPEIEREAYHNHLSTLKSRLAHFFSLETPAIQNADPGYMTPDDLIEHLAEIEDKYIAENKGTLTPQDTDKIFLDCGGGWAWWLLPRASCSDEASAMGHCGNSPAGHRSDLSILSLRQRKPSKGGRGRWEPHCTFILHQTDGQVDHGLIGEMKGKGNAKPTAKYHPMIVKLLEDVRIEGILGGGYLPKNNFSFGDLTEAEQAQVRAANPEATWNKAESVGKLGYTPERLIELLNLDLDAHFTEGDVEGLEVRRWTDAQELAGEWGDDDTQIIAASSGGDMEIFADFLRELKPDGATLAAISRQITLEFNQSVDLQANDLLEEVAETIDSLDDNGESVLRTGLEAAMVVGHGWKVDPKTFVEVFQSAAAASMNDSDGYAGHILVLEGGEIIQYLEMTEAIELAREHGEDTDDIDWASPSMLTFNLSDHDDLYEADAAMAELERRFEITGVPPRTLEQAGQGRLFRRPDSVAEAERGGIKHSYLLQPKHAMTTSIKLAATDYPAMFRELLALAPDFAGEVERHIGWARRALKKDNRIVWYLRWVRMELVQEAIDFMDSDRRVPEKPETDEEKADRAPGLQAMFDKYLREAQAKAGVDERKVRSSIINLTGSITQNWLEHIFSLPTPAIQGYDPGFKIPAQVRKELDPLEVAFKADAKGTVVPRTEDTVYLDCGGGWAWWLLPRAACDDESAAMGHCGNSPERTRKDRAILSLRQKRSKGGVDRWEPHLTFILHTEKNTPSGPAYLGEMKGKGNDKPSPKYFPQIMRLLEDHRILGIKGGGYLATHNFSFNDLSEDQKTEVRAANPNAVWTFDDLLRQKGLDASDIADRLDLALNSYDPKIEGEGGFVIDTYTLSQFVRDFGDDGTQSMVQGMEGDMSFFSYNFFEHLPTLSEGVLGGVARQIDKEFPDHSVGLREGMTAEQMIAGIRSSLDDIRAEDTSELKLGLEEAFLRGQRWKDPYNSFRKLLTARIKDVETDGGDGVDCSVEVESNGRIIRYVPAREALDLYESLKEQEGDEDESDEVDGVDWNRPDINTFNQDDPEFDLEAVESTLIEHFGSFGRVGPKALEEKGQDRLFPRPETPEEARRDGIKHSRLLQPKAATALSDTLGSAMASHRQFASPEIARFDGIRVTVYANDHEPPHVHTETADSKARYEVPEGTGYRGEALPSPQDRKFQAWTRMTEPESGRTVGDLLYEQWLAVRNRKQPVKVPTPDEILARKGKTSSDVRHGGDFYRIRAVEALPEFRLRVEFENGGTRVADIRAMRGDNPMFAPAFDHFDEVQWTPFHVEWPDPSNGNTIEIEDQDLWGAGDPEGPSPSGSKVAYIAPTEGELTVTLDLGARPKVTLSLDLGIPNFSRFAISVPVDNLSNEQIDLFCRQALDALLQNVTAFLVSMQFPEALIADVLSRAETAFMELDGKAASDAEMPAMDLGLRMYEAHFPLPEEFAFETQAKVVMANVVRRQPVVHEIELVPLESITTDGGEAAKIIEFHLDQATRGTPRAFGVRVIEPATPGKARNWATRALATA